MNSFQLKIAALILMTIDHIGVILFPQNIILRVIGRLSFPIFVFLILEGYKYTKNYNLFLKRLGLFAVIIEIPNFLLNYSSSLNIFFTLFAGLIVVKSLDQKEKRYLIPMFLIASDLFHFDYSTYGILLFVVFYYIYKYEVSLLNRFLIVTLFHLTIQIPIIYTLLNFRSEIQIFAIFSVLVVSLYNGEKGYDSKVTKYLFYLYYPIHIIALTIISFL